MNDEDYESQTALHLAAGGGHHDIVLELLSAGADTDARSLLVLQKVPSEGS